MAARYDSVARHTRWVQWLKIALPLLAVGLIAAMFLIPRERVEGGLTAAQIAALGAGLKLDNPRFSGATDDGEPYEITAAWALPDSAMPDVIDLDQPKGRIVTNGSGLVTVEALKGVFVRSAESLTLNGGVVIVTADGYRFETESAELDVAGRSVTSPGAVRITGPFGSIEAGSMRATDPAGPEESGDVPAGMSGAARIWFENRVRMVILPQNTN